jgi:hypothetical protein
MRKGLSISLLLLASMFASTALGAGFSHTLSVASMPSSQGYGYFAFNSALTESQVFSTDGSILTASTIGNGYQGQGSNYAYLPFTNTETSWNWVLEARVRVLQGELWSFHYGFFLAGWIDGAAAGVGIMPSTVQNYSLNGVYARDNTQWTDWAIVTDRAAGTFNVYADGSLLFTDYLVNATGSPGYGLPLNHIAFGDGTGGANSRAEIASLRFRQLRVVPEPTTLAMLAGLGAIALRRR